MVPELRSQTIVRLPIPPTSRTGPIWTPWVKRPIAAASASNLGEVSFLRMLAFLSCITEDLVMKYCLASTGFA